MLNIIPPKSALFFLLLISCTSNAGSSGEHDIKMMFGSDIIMFGTSTPPADTCSHHGRHFKFDATTESGKNLLSILLAAKLANKKIDIWYKESTAPGKVGCNSNEVSEVINIGIR